MKSVRSRRSPGRKSGLDKALALWRRGYWDGPLPGAVGFAPVAGPRVDREVETAQFTDGGDAMQALAASFADNLIQAALEETTVPTLAEASALLDATGSPGVLIEINIVMSPPSATGDRVRQPLAGGMRIVGSGATPFETALYEAAYPRPRLEGLPTGYAMDFDASRYLWAKADPQTGDIVTTEIAGVFRRQMRNEIQVKMWDGELVRQLGNAATLATVAEIAEAAIVRAGTQEQRNAMAALHAEIAATRAELNEINQRLKDELAKQVKLGEQARVWAAVGAIADFAASLGTLLEELGAFAPEGLDQAATKEEVQAILDAGLSRTSDELRGVINAQNEQISKQNEQIRRLNMKLRTMQLPYEFQPVIELRPGGDGSILP